MSTCLCNFNLYFSMIDMCVIWLNLIGFFTAGEYNLWSLDKRLFDYISSMLMLLTLHGSVWGIRQVLREQKCLFFTKTQNKYVQTDLTLILLTPYLGGEIQDGALFMFWIIWNWFTNQVSREIVFSLFHWRGKKHFLVWEGQPHWNAILKWE